MGWPCTQPDYGSRSVAVGVVDRDVVPVADEVRGDGTADVPEPDDAEALAGAHFGAIRIAPSSRIVSPFSITFSTMCRTSAANSAGRPSRDGNGICAASACRTGSGAIASMGVSKVPGAIVHTRIPSEARSRAIGNVMPTTPPFDAEYAAWPIWPSNAAIDAVLTTTPRSPSSL